MVFIDNTADACFEENKADGFTINPEDNTCETFKRLKVEIPIVIEDSEGSWCFAKILKNTLSQYEL